MRRRGSVGVDYILLSDRLGVSSTDCVYVWGIMTSAVLYKPQYETCETLQYLITSRTPHISHYTTPNTTVALKLTSLPAGITTGTGWPSASTSRYSSVRNELDFQPQDWLTENVSGALVNRVKLAPVALAHAIVKYAHTAGRGSR